MSYALRNVGANATGNLAGTSGTLSPGAPSGKSSGDLLLLYAVNRSNANGVTTPSGWTIVSISSNVSWNVVFARIADGTATDTPTVTFTAPATVGHVYACIAAFTGGPASLVSIVNVANDQQLPASQTDVEYSTLPVSTNNCLVIAATTKNKTSVSDGTTFNAFSGMTQLDQFSGSPANGTNVSVYWGYQVQTTATTINAGVQTLTGTTETLQYTSILVALNLAATLAASPLGPYAYALSDVTFSTSQSGNPYMFAAPLNYNYGLAPASSDLEIDPNDLVYAYGLSPITFTLSTSAYGMSASTITYAHAVESVFLSNPPNNPVFAMGPIHYSLSLADIALVVVPVVPVGTFPQLVGLSLQEAETLLQSSGALNPAALGYFGNWPISVLWVQSAAAAGTVMQPGLVVGQNPLPATPIVVNAPITLTVIEQPTSVSYPGTNPSINNPVL